MTFGAPLFFWALALLPVLLALFARNELRRRQLIEQLVASRLLDSLAGSVSPTKRRLRFILFLLGFAGLIVALTRPQLGYRTEEHRVNGKDVLIAIDTSRSMLANDVSPSRLARAKFAAEDLITQLHGDRVGLIAFAGTAFLQAPLTADYSAVLDSLHELDTNIIPVGGTDIAEAIRTAVEAFGAGESDNRALILFTDGEELDEDAVAAAKALKGGIKIYTVGVGTADGTVIALPGAGAAEYIKSPDGQIVKSRLDEPRLRAIAEATGGFYVHLESGPLEMQQIISQGLNSLNSGDKGVEITRRPLEQYQWPLGAGLLLLLLSRLPSERRARRSRTFPVAAPAAATALLLLVPRSAFSKNSGVEAYEREDYNRAKETFQKQLDYLPDSDKLQFDLGSAAYKTGDLDQALNSFSKALTTKDQDLREKAEYNLGNTLFRRGAIQKEKEPKLKDWKNSLQHYDEALKAQPKDADAKYNRDLIQRMIEELEKEPPKSDQQKNDQKDQDKKDQKKQNQQDQNSGQKQNQQKQDQKDQKGKQQEQQQGQSKDQKDQQQQGQQSKDQQDQQQQGQQSKDQQGQQQQGQQPKDQQGQQQQGQQPKDQQGQQQQGQQPKDQQGQQQQAQQPKEQQGEGGKDQQAQQQPAQPAEQQPGQQESKQPDHKLSGQITDAQQREADEKKEAAQEAEAAAKGEMTPAQAAALLDSVKDDAHLAPSNPRNPKTKDRTLRDW